MYQTEDGQTKIDIRLEDETVWMTQKSMAELYQKGVPTINEHIKNIFEEGELLEKRTIRKNRIVQFEDNREVERDTNFYNLEMIIAVGYRVRSHRGTQFRKWATTQLNEYLVKGFVMDDDRLKELKNLGSDYFDELLERIRDIRASEKLDAFLQFNGRELLTNAGKVSKEVAEKLALEEYQIYNQSRVIKDAKSDFLDFIKENDIR